MRVFAFIYGETEDPVSPILLLAEDVEDAWRELQKKQEPGVELLDLKAMYHLESSFGPVASLPGEKPSMERLVDY